ncbi:hypothetical protein MMC08_001981 [Hypocenomyce scalaris]|nr:hypothetical protein [Hypocenomyce scalaris]
MDKITNFFPTKKVVVKLMVKVRHASIITMEALSSYPAKEPSAQAAEAPTFYMDQTSPTSCQQRFISPRSSALTSSQGSLVLYNPDLMPARPLRSADELLPDGEITAESFELQVTDEEADNEPYRDEPEDNIPRLEKLPRVESRPESRLGFHDDPHKDVISSSHFPTETALRRGTNGDPCDVRNRRRVRAPRQVRPARSLCGPTPAGRAQFSPVTGPQILSKEAFQIMPQKPLIQRLTGGLVYKEALAKLQHLTTRAELPEAHSSHHCRRLSWLSSPSIREHSTETSSCQLPVLSFPRARSRRMVAHGGTFVTFDSAYYTYMHYRRLSREQRFLERGLEGWSRKFEGAITLAHELADSLKDWRTFDITS